MADANPINPVDTPEIGGGVGGPLSPGDISRDLADTKLIGRAIREGWPIFASDKSTIIRKMMAKVEKDTVTTINARGEEIELDNDRNQIAAAKVVIDADKMNQTDYWGEDKNARIEWAPFCTFLKNMRALTSDGALIEVQSDGMRHGPVEVMARLARGEAVGRDEYFFRTIMRFQTGAPAWVHLNKVLALAVGQREARAVLLDVYRMT